jgi:hypothetical protein
MKRTSTILNSIRELSQELVGWMNHNIKPFTIIVYAIPGIITAKEVCMNTRISLLYTCVKNRNGERVSKQTYPS